MAWIFRNGGRDAKRIYDITTVAYVFNTNFIMGSGKVLRGQARSVYVPVERSIDIDTLFYFEIAEFLMYQR